MKLEVVTPLGEKVAETDITEVVATGALGEFGVMADHEPLITALVPGRLVYTKAGREATLAADQGFLEVSGDTVRVITETALRPEEIDVERAQRAFDRATERLAQDEYQTADKRPPVAAALARATCRLAVAALAHN